MKRLKCFVIVGFVFVLIVGIVSHFVYEWSGKSTIIGFLFPVNESTWEHMKLCFFPMLYYSFYMNRKLKEEYPCVTSSLLFGILFSTFLVPVLFYTYTGVLGRNYMPLDIATFVISVLLGFGAIYRFTSSCKVFPYELLLQTLVVIMAICFFLFTYHPPDLGIFVAPN